MSREPSEAVKLAANKLDIPIQLLRSDSPAAKAEIRTRLHSAVLKNHTDRGGESANASAFIAARSEVMKFIKNQKDTQDPEVSPEASTGVLEIKDIPYRFFDEQVNLLRTEEEAREADVSIASYQKKYEEDQTKDEDIKGTEVTKWFIKQATPLIHKAESLIRDHKLESIKEADPRQSYHDELIKTLDSIYQLFTDLKNKIGYNQPMVNDAEGILWAAIFNQTTNGHDPLDPEITRVLENSAAHSNQLTPSMRTLRAEGMYLAQLEQLLMDRLNLIRKISPENIKATVKEDSSSVHKRPPNLPIHGQFSDQPGSDYSVRTALDSRKLKEYLETRSKRRLAEVKELSAAFDDKRLTNEKTNLELVLGNVISSEKTVRFEAIKKAICTELDNYIKTKQGNSAGCQRAKNLKTSIIELGEDDPAIKKFFGLLHQHFNRTEGLGLFQHKGRLNDDSLDTRLLALLFGYLKRTDSRSQEFAKCDHACIPGELRQLMASAGVDNPSLAIEAPTAFDPNARESARSVFITLTRDFALALEAKQPLAIEDKPRLP